MFGGSPGILEYKSSLHASHGLASMALAYIAMDNLPSSMLEKLDLEYFEKAVQYMKNHPQIQGENGIGISAICKGAQVALMMATYLEDIRCVVAINGSCVGGCGTFKYKERDFDYDVMEYHKIIPGEDNDLADMFNITGVENVDSLRGFIPFHKKRRISYLLISGLADTCMPSRFMVREMERLLHEENHPDFEIIKYTDAGHFIEPSYMPFLNLFYQAGPKFNAFLTNGGKLKPHCKSNEDSWPKLLNFLKQKLSTKPDSMKSKF